MVRPAAFMYNKETAANNFFQNQSTLSQEVIHQKALQEFDEMAELLRSNRINVLVINDTDTPPKPDAIFPNNWLSTEANGTIHVFSMFAVNRRVERRNDVIEQLTKNFNVTNIYNWAQYEKQNLFLEGTGSMVIDHFHQIIYACPSPRTNAEMVKQFANAINYKPLLFTAVDESGNTLYHTNVMLCIGDDFAVLCADAVADDEEKAFLVQSLEVTGHEIILFRLAK